MTTRLCPKAVGGLLFPGDDDGGGDENGRVGSGDEADQQDEGKVIQDRSAPDEKTERYQENRQDGDGGPGEGFVDGTVEDGGWVFHFTQAPEIFPDAVKDDDRIVYGITQDGQESRDDQTVHLPPGYGQEGERDQEVVNKGNYCADRKTKFKTDRYVNHDTGQGNQATQDSLLAYCFAHRRAYLFFAEYFNRLAGKCLFDNWDDFAAALLSFDDNSGALLTDSLERDIRITAANQKGSYYSDINRLAEL